MKRFCDFIMLVILLGCSNNKQYENLISQKKIEEESCFTSEDSAYWISRLTYKSSGNDNIVLFEENLDSLEMKSYEDSKQILKGMYINYCVSNQDSSDPDQYYFKDYDGYKKEISAVLDCVSHYLYTHGYKKIDEDLFKQRLLTFYGYKWEDMELEDNFFSYRYGKNKDIQDFPIAVTSFQKRVLIDYYNDKNISLKIEGEKWDNDGYDDLIGSYINRRMNMESFENGELQIDMDLKSLLHQHMYLFNDSKAAKTWLVCNQIDFFIYNIDYYDEDKEINRKKLDYLLKKCTNSNGEMEVGCNEELVEHCVKGLHNNMLKLIFEETDTAMTTYENGGKYDTKAFDLLYDYFKIVYVNNKDDKKIAIKNQINQLEKLCVFLKMEVSLNKKHCKHNNSGWFNDSDALSITFQCLNDSLLEVAKQHNYYNIPNFDEVLKVYKWDSENAYRDKSGIPFDYTTLLE